ncbi:uncharacterized protein HD556DRAFT_1439351 [Suillus plorans]|uniref:Uncharacterized protein n=1 Tax=Suillus plorans TaxID=116603 RepID=A0A9P7J2J8_9AGAM|nr:uncharacterized protein HD556DRAFT_1439351 [Suillus plorans]KAG1799692.1 hypothetical protein HD556DRAFT_1439351 [Suillus plorans]
MFPNSSSDRQLYVCVCSKHNLGQPHQVSKSTWHRHLEAATTEQERERIRSGRALQGHSIPLETNVGAAGNTAPAGNSDRMDEEDSRRTAQRDKCARVGHQDVQEVSRNNSPDLLQPLHPDEPPHPDPPPDPPQPPDPDEPPHPDAPPDPPQPPDPDEPLHPDKPPDPLQPPDPDEPLHPDEPPHPDTPPDPPQPPDPDEPPHPDEPPDPPQQQQQQYEIRIERRQRPDIDIVALAQSAVVETRASHCVIWHFPLGSTQHDLQHHSVCYPQLFPYEAQLSRARRSMRA